MVRQVARRDSGVDSGIASQLESVFASGASVLVCELDASEVAEA